MVLEHKKSLAFLLPESCTNYLREAQKALCLKRSWSDFDPQAYYPYGEDQNHETSFKGKALQAAVDSWCKIQVLILCISMMLVGCAPPAYRAHPEFEIRAGNFSTMGLMPCDIKAYEVSGLGLVELRDDWCITSKKNVMNALIKGFKDKHYNIKTLTIDQEIEEEMDGIRALYRVVNKSIQLHAYGPQLFPEKGKNFEYSLGSVEEILRRSGADSLVFVSGLDHESRGGRAAFVSVTVADSSGAIVWYCVKGIQGERGLRDPEIALGLMQEILASFPEVGG